MRQSNLFKFVVKYLGPFKYVPGLPLVFDAWLQLVTFVGKPKLLHWLDEIEAGFLQLEDTSTCIHHYGGLQFNYKGKEVGHIHSNGLLDLLISRRMKQQLLDEGRVTCHHLFKNTGWVSFYIRTENDKDYAMMLINLTMQHKTHALATQVLKNQF